MSDQEEFTYPVKPQAIKSKEKFEAMADEMLGAWKEYKKLDARMKLLDASTKQYMIDNKMDTHKCEKGSIAIVPQTRRMLDRELIDDIEQYKVDVNMFIAYKSAK
jgi:hypothetical protein